MEYSHHSPRSCERPANSWDRTCVKLLCVQPQSDTSSAKDARRVISTEDDLGYGPSTFVLHYNLMRHRISKARKSLVKPLRTANRFSFSTSLHGSAAGQRVQLDSWTDRQDTEAEVERNGICYHGRDGVAKQRPNTPTCIHALAHTYTHMCAAAKAQCPEDSRRGGGRCVNMGCLLGVCFERVGR
ncbi:hypothetical protein AOLI_G00000920 [Acnodon oligacanthus]